MIAAAAVATYQLSFFAAVADTGVAVGTIVALGSAPALAGGIEWAITRKPPAKAWAMATALASAGVAMLALAGADASISLPGVGLALCAGASYAGVHAGGQADAQRRPLARDRDGRRVRARRGPARARPRRGGRGPRTPEGAALIVFLGIVPTALAYLLFARGLKRLSAAETATLTLAEPLTAALLGVIVLSERMSAPAALGGALILAGLLVLAAPEVRRPATVPA